MATTTQLSESTSYEWIIPTKRVELSYLHEAYQQICMEVVAVIHILELWAFGNQVPWQIHRERGPLNQRFAFVAWNLLLLSARTVADHWTAASYVLQNPVRVCSEWSGLIGSLSQSSHSKILLPFDVNRKNQSIRSHISNEQDISYVAYNIRSEYSLRYHDFSHHKH